MPNSDANDRSGRASGEVSERGELLDGSLQLALEGSCELAGVEWIVSMTLAWPLAEAGEVPLAEGDLALDATERGLFAVLEEGVAANDPDTGAAQITARFRVDATDGEPQPDADDAVGGIECAIEVGVEEWRGELTFVGPG
jgi:hypothetical protein